MVPQWFFFSLFNLSEFGFLIDAEFEKYSCHMQYNIDKSLLPKKLIHFENKGLTKNLSKAKENMKKYMPCMIQSVGDCGWNLIELIKK